MKPGDMPIVEASGRVRFRNRERLIAHVIKHLIEGRDERWQHVIDEHLLTAARLECRTGQPGVALNTLAQRYQALVGQVLVNVCRQGHSHQHSCRERWDFAESAYKAVFQIIDGWPEQEKIIIAASALVKGERVKAYRLLTAYRPWPRLSANSHRRKARERLRNLRTLSRQTILELHDE